MDQEVPEKRHSEGLHAYVPSTKLFLINHDLKKLQQGELRKRQQVRLTSIAEEVS